MKKKIKPHPSINSMLHIPVVRAIFIPYPSMCIRVFILHKAKEKARNIYRIVIY